MLHNSEFSQPEVLDTGSWHETRKVKLDLHVLRYMAQRIEVHLLGLAASVSLPSVDYAEERHNRTHRIVVYNRQEIGTKSSLMFVGFISGIQAQVSLATLQELHRVDKVLITELANHPGLLSYSSLELRKGRWYNLVLLSDYSAKLYFKQSSTHRYAAYQLATHYYAWIRLHNGIMPCGLKCNEMLLESTKYYVFPEIGSNPLYEKD